MWYIITVGYTNNDRFPIIINRYMIEVLIAVFLTTPTKIYVNRVTFYPI